MMRALEQTWRQHLEWADTYLSKALEANGLITVASCTADAIRNLEAALAIIRAGAGKQDWATSRHNGDGAVTDFIPEPDLQALGMVDEVPPGRP